MFSRYLETAIHKRCCSENLRTFSTLTAFPSYNILREEARSFCFGWRNPPCDIDIEAEASSFSFRAWKYTDRLNIWGVLVVVFYKKCGGEGFIAEFDVNLDFTNQTMKELVENLWMTEPLEPFSFFEFTAHW